jgi:glycosyltransferase involved in cell wall biosynthesis
VKLLFVIENDQPHASGGGYYAPFKFAEFLARRGHVVEVYAVHDLGWVAPAPGLRVRYRPSIPRRNRFLRKMDKMLAAACDRTLLEPRTRALRPDWILGVFKESAIKAVALGRRHGARVANFVYECPPWLEETAGGPLPEPDDGGYTRDLWERTRRAYVDSDILFPNSELARSWNARWVGREVAEPIYPGIDAAQMPIAPVSGPAAGAGPRRILYVGRLAPAKNVDLLIRAHQALDHPGAELHICGEGPEEGRLRSLAGGRPDVVFHGFVGERDLWALYRGADLVVCPSSFEGFGMPPMQALYFGKPCLVSDIPIFRSVYGDHVEYFPRHDLAGLTAALRRLLADAPYRARRGRDGRAFVLDRFTWSGAAAGIEAALLAHEGRVPAAGIR